ncbi:1-(5-phosphoribosyl)-5-[(5-phosphoribosylamino)methylideneamino]imidazole-4-carboxamide isomerase [Candidatus Omnitrophota bacterium]
MIILPAIDLRQGRVVRLTQGDFAREKFYSGSPGEVAKLWESQGAKWLHVVDLDGALAGEPQNADALEQILTNVSIPVQLGGGLRTFDSISKVLDMGVSRVIIGTRAYDDEEFIKKLVGKYEDKIAVGIDAAGKDVVVAGWTSKTHMTSDQLAKRMESIGVETIIYTNVLKDGTLEGPEEDLAIDMLDAVKANVIISGGISSIDDIAKLKALSRRNLYGVITGKALYEGKLDLAQAIKIAEE